MNEEQQIPTLEHPSNSKIKSNLKIDWCERFYVLRDVSCSYCSDGELVFQELDLNGIPSGATYQSRCIFCDGNEYTTEKVPLADALEEIRSENDANR